MFSLIITIISIALVAALALATIYYGGTAFTQGSAKAGAATMVAQAQQIAAAEVLYANDHNGTYDLTTTDTVPLSGLTSAVGSNGSYLSAIPTGLWTVVAGATTPISVVLTGVSAAVCGASTASNGTQYSCAAGVFTFND